MATFLVHRVLKSKFGREKMVCILLDFSLFSTSICLFSPLLLPEQQTKKLTKGEKLTFTSVSPHFPFI